MNFKNSTFILGDGKLIGASLADGYEAILRKGSALYACVFNPETRALVRDAIPVSYADERHRVGNGFAERRAGKIYYVAR